MNNLMRQRRLFLQMGVSGVSLFAAGLLKPAALAASHSAVFHSLADLGPLQAPDANGIMLPAGLKSRVVARSGQAAASTSSYLWHGAPDGGACFATEDGGWIYVSNCEGNDGAGGVGALRFSANGSVVDSYPILQNTTRNCAGGATPWGSWLSCEEFDRGQVWECDPVGNREAVLRPLLGTFEHEAAAVDLAHQCIYLTEDDREGGFYRFVASNGLPDLSAGRLEIAEIVSSGGESRVRWHEVPDPVAELIPARFQVEASTSFNGGEGIAVHDGKTYFVTKGDNRIWCYHNSSQKIEILYDAATHDDPILTGVDNVVITPAGDVLVAEDGGNMQIVALTPEGRLFPLLQIVGHEESEITGPAFDPSHQRLYFSSQRGAEGRSDHGVTFEISAV
jgi:secreted PhoX family phosphatase